MVATQRKLNYGKVFHRGIQQGTFEVTAVYDGFPERSGRFETAKEAADAFVKWNLQSARSELKTDLSTRDFYCVHQHATVRNVLANEVVAFIRFRNPQRGEKLPVAIVVDLIGETSAA
jgi:hypothetical protein